MEIHFQTIDHVVGVEKVAEQHIAITHSKVGQSSPNQKKFEERKNSLGQVIYQKCITIVVSEKTA